MQYSTWVSVVRREAASQGADLSEFETNSEVVATAAAIWNDRKDEIQAADMPEGQSIAKDEISVA